MAEVRSANPATCLIPVRSPPGLWSCRCAKACKAGRIHVEKDGAIDRKRADREWAVSMIPASGKRPHMKPGESTSSAKPGGGRSSFADARVRSEWQKPGWQTAHSGEGRSAVEFSFAKKAAFAFTVNSATGSRVGRRNSP